MNLTAHLHNKLVEAGQHAIACRPTGSAETKKHAEALRELDSVIAKAMDTAPAAFRYEAIQALEEQRRKRDA